MKKSVEDHNHEYHSQKGGDESQPGKKSSRYLNRGRKSGSNLPQVTDETNNNSLFENGISNFPIFQWSNDLIGYLTNLFETILNGSDFIIPQNSNTTKGNIQINFFLILLEHLENEIIPLNMEFLHNLKTSDKDFFLKIVTFMNSISYFLTLFMEFIDLLHDKFATDIIESCFEEKFLQIYQRCMDLNYNAIEILCRNVFFHEVKSIFQANLFNTTWLNDMVGIMQMKKFIRTSLLQVNSILMISLSGSSAGGGSGSLSVSGLSLSGKFGTDENTNDDERLSLSQSGHQSQNIPETIKHKLLVTIIEGIIAMYLELLFTAGYHNLPNLTVEIMGRLSEDLQMVTSFFEELRQIILQNQYYSQNIHFISKRKSGSALSSFFSSKQHVSSPVSNSEKETDQEHAMKKKKKYFFSRAWSVSSSSSHQMKATSASSLSNYPRKDVIIQNIQNKQLFDELLFPLQHVIYAVQMHRNHLLEFIQTEIYSDFGYLNALRVWQLLLAWRGIKKDEINADYDMYLKDWKPKDAGQLEPKLHIHYLINHKTNVLKITKQSNPDF
jgi:hypothetical protein